MAKGGQCQSHSQSQSQTWAQQPGNPANNQQPAPNNHPNNPATAGWRAEQ